MVVGWLKCSLLDRWAAFFHVHAIRVTMMDSSETILNLYTRESSTDICSAADTTSMHDKNDYNLISLFLKYSHLHATITLFNSIRYD